MLEHTVPPSELLSESPQGSSVFIRILDLTVYLTTNLLHLLPTWLPKPPITHLRHTLLVCNSLMVAPCPTPTSNHSHSPLMDCGSPGCSQVLSLHATTISEVHPAFDYTYSLAFSSIAHLLRRCLQPLEFAKLSLNLLQFILLASPVPTPSGVSDLFSIGSMVPTHSDDLRQFSYISPTSF